MHRQRRTTIVEQLQRTRLRRPEGDLVLAVEIGNGLGATAQERIEDAEAECGRSAVRGRSNAALRWPLEASPAHPQHRSVGLRRLRQLVFAAEGMFDDADPQ